MTFKNKNIYIKAFSWEKILQNKKITAYVTNQKDILN